MKNKKERVLIQEDQGLINKYKTQIENVKPKLQSVVDEWEKLGIIPMESIDLHIAIEKPERFYDSKIMEKLPEPEESEVAGFKVKKASIKESLELPDPNKFYAAARVASEALRKSSISNFIYEIEDGTVIVDEKRKEEAFDSARIYAESEKQHEVVALIKGFIEASEKLDAFLKENKVGQLYNVNTGHKLHTENLVKVWPDGLRIDPHVVAMVKHKEQRYNI